jgi:hypothetical protein
MDEEKKIKTEKSEEMKKEIDRQVMAHAKKAEQNIRERIAKAKEQGLYEEKSKTPYVDELEWTVKQIYQMKDSIYHLELVAKRIEKSLKIINENQIQIADGISNIWQYLIMSMPTIDHTFTEQFANYIDFVKEAKEIND